MWQTESIVYLIGSSSTASAAELSPVISLLVLLLFPLKCFFSAFTIYFTNAGKNESHFWLLFFEWKLKEGMTACC